MKHHYFDILLLYICVHVPRFILYLSIQEDNTYNIMWKVV